MPIKRAAVGAETFDKQPTAIDKLVSGPSRSEAGEAQPETPAASQGQQRVHKPTSFYLDDEQIRKLDRLAYEYNEQKGTRINRNHIIRHLVGIVELGDLLREDLKKK
jgi:hypothetical protein